MWPAGKQAVITLHTLYAPDALPFRSLTLNTDYEEIIVGRSSKREAKKLVPAHHNAYFDSRVMSRNHARLTAFIDTETLWLEDLKSMHGTYVNDRRISEGRVPIKTGDVLTFGTEVTRGTETFQPIKVRVKFQIFGARDEVIKPETEAAQSKRATNTFSVPDDYDSDVVEVVHDSAPAKKATAHYEIEDSDHSSDAENQPPLDWTPITSPSNKDIATIEVEKESSRDAPGTPRASTEINMVSDGSKESPIVLGGDQPLVTPRMTPSASDIPNLDGNVHKKEILSVAANDSDSSELEFSVDESDNDDDSVASSNASVSMAYERPCVESDSDMSYSVEYIEEDEYPESDYPKSEHIEHYTKVLPDPSSMANNGSGCVAPDTVAATTQPRIDEPVSFPQFMKNTHGKGDRCSSSMANNDGSHSPGDVPVATPPQIKEAIPFQEHWTAVPKAPSNPSSPLRRPTFKQHDYLSSYRYGDSCPPTLDDWISPDSAKEYSFLAPIPAFPQAFTEFMQSHPLEMTGAENRPTGFFSSEKHSFLPNYSSLHANSRPDIYKPGLASVAHAPSPPTYPTIGVGLTQQKSDSKASHDSVALHRPTSNKTRVSIADIVDASTSEVPPMPQTPLKRKAADMELDSLTSDAFELKTLPQDSAILSNGQLADDHEFFSQDAQRQNGESISSQLSAPLSVDGESSNLQSTANSTSEDERPRKRVKTSEGSRAGGLRSHAATAVLGVVVGGLSTIALLASLPPDFFN